MRYLDGPVPRIFGHRGASAERPENTIEAFETALAQGATMLELDVRLTSDGEVVVLHDPTVDRTTDGAGEVSSLTLKQLRALDAGCRFVDPRGERPFAARGALVPTLDAVLARFDRAGVNIEVKSAASGVEHAVMRVIDRRDARARVLLTAESGALMERLRAAVQGQTRVLTGFSIDDVMEFVARAGDPSYVPPGAALQLPREFNGARLVTPELVAAAHARGVEVHVWVLNTYEELSEMLSLGVDGVMTDFPSRAAEIVRAGAAV